MAIDTAMEVVAPVRTVTAIDKGLTLSTAEVIERTKRIREVMEAVMKPNVHFGIIPGTQKPTMYQPGADVLNVTFRIAPKVATIDDLSDEDRVRYRITVQGVHQVTSEILAEGVGECSSDEEKYRWRKAVCDEEWTETPADRRREKWAKGREGKAYKTKQVRTSPADVGNTVLKMALKRAKVAMTISATAASDVFNQDLEDLSEELREHLVHDESEPRPEPPKPAQRKSEQAQPAAAGNGHAAKADPPAKASAPPQAPSSSGVIAEMVPKGDAALIKLDTGFVCSTRNPEFIKSAMALADAKTRVDLGTKASSDPAKYAPVLESITPVGTEGAAS